MRCGWVVAATLSVAVVSAAVPASADCQPERSGLTALKQADVVFRGTVRDVNGSRDPTWRYGQFPEAKSGFRAAVVAFDVSRVWKGPVGKRFVLHIARTQEDDAFEDFERGSEYLVFARRNSPYKTALFGLPEPTYGATGCGGTTSLLMGMMTLIDLGPGRSPE